MKETYFSSDHHFGHVKILEYEKQARPFSSVEEMNEVLIERWNSVVKPEDTIYHLGDFAFGRANVHIAGRLNGKKRLIMGNHDHYPTAEYAAYFEKIYGVFFWKRCILTHVPVHPIDLGSRWFLNVHGHLHRKVVLEPRWNTPDKNYLNVSVERHNLTPINADVIMQRLKELDEEQ
jgi:calcineurin-like phosphoesterase family protein